MQSNVMITGGGTGGHLGPGIALYESFREKDIRVIFLAGKRDKRFSMLSEIPTEDLFLYSAPSLTFNIIKIPFFLIMFLISFMTSLRIIKKNDIGAVIGMGGFVSAPALLAAKVSGVKIYLCEQNSVPGRVTMMFERFSVMVCSSFMVTKKYLKDKSKFIYTGNPLRKKIMDDVSKKEARRAFNLDHTKKIILVLGGSQGAVKINQLILGLKKDYEDDFENTGFIWCTGEFSYEKFKNLVHNEVDEGSIYLSPYIKKIGLAYRAADLAISRAGAGVMMELASTGVPSILVPYPYSTKDHQTLNAESFAADGAAIMIPDIDAVPDKVASILSDLIKNERKLNMMSENALKISRTDAAGEIVKRITEDVIVP